LSLSIIWKRFAVVLKNDPDFVSIFNGGPRHKSGRTRKINSDENEFFIDFVAENGHLTSQGLRDNFIPLYHGGEALLEDPPYSARTVRRQLIRNRLSIKAMERRHILRDDALGIRFLDSIADINPLDLIEIDERGFLCSERYSPENGMGTRSFSAVTPLGFLCWQTFEGKYLLLHNNALAFRVFLG